MDDRSARMAFLLRREAGRRRLPDFLARLSESLGREVTPADVLPLERGDELWEPAWARIRAAGTQGPPAFSRWAPTAIDHLETGLAEFGAAVGDRTVLYAPPPILGIGPVRVSPGEIAPRLRIIAVANVEECTVIREDGRCGLRLDYHWSDHEHGEPFPFELTVWGTDWEALAALIVPFDSAAPVP